jgi:AraC-like DNA-binding protein
MRELNCYAHILDLYALIGRNHLQSVYANTNIQPARQQAYLSVFDHVMRYIDHHYMEDISLDTVAAEAGFSKYHFSRLFKQHTNTTFLHFLCLKRIQAAERLLSSTNRSIAEIALKAGFDSIPSFNRIYRKMRNCTPTQYRAKCQKVFVPLHTETL